MRSVGLIIAALLALNLWYLVAQAALTPGMEAGLFLHQVSGSLLALGGLSSLLGLLKGRGGLGHSPILGRASLLLIVTGALGFCAASRMGWDEANGLKFAGISLVVYATGCLFYWVSLAEREQLARIH